MKTPLKTIVAQYMDSGDQSSQAFRRLYNFGIRGCQEFNIDIYGDIKTEILTVSANKTVMLPTDYVTFSKLGILNSSGEIVPLRANPDLTTISREAQAALSLVTDPFEYSPTKFPLLWMNFNYGGSNYQVYGLGYGDWRNWRIQGR